MSQNPAYPTRLWGGALFLFSIMILQCNAASLAKGGSGLKLPDVPNDTDAPVASSPGTETAIEDTDVFSTGTLSEEERASEAAVESLQLERDKQEQRSDLHRKLAQAFLEENRQKPDVVETQSGLQYRILKKGKGPSPGIDDSVVVHYRGFLLTGEVIDSSYRRESPATFPVSRVIKGWTEALQLMKKGAKWEVFIPADLAYGERQVGQTIPAGALLVFEIELLDVLPPPPRPSSEPAFF
ncbi:MAG: FKBP-type peptidyl-prolyl cis-trans isomerase [Deltaproteobacteria bacterium]|nr:FKBP-type peptidyl-prolyl cis-trans isomerase [Deltaproteobacteria bacterium]